MDIRAARLVTHAARQYLSPRLSRCAHTSVKPIIPKPTPFVPDTKTFLTLIGRGLSQHASKIPSWDALFTLSSAQLRDSGIEPARTRRYLLQWRERFRNGIQGMGGDMRHVTDGKGLMRIMEVPAAPGRAKGATLTRSPGMRKVVLNIDPQQGHGKISQAVGVKMVKIVRGGQMVGSHVEAVKGDPSLARIQVKEGLWEQSRGRKVDGGERRKAEVRAKRRAAENKMRR